MWTNDLPISQFPSFILLESTPIHSEIYTHLINSHNKNQNVQKIFFLKMKLKVSVEHNAPANVCIWKYLKSWDQMQMVDYWWSLVKKSLEWDNWEVIWWILHECFLILTANTWKIGWTREQHQKILLKKASYSRRLDRETWPPSYSNNSIRFYNTFSTEIHVYLYIIQ
jgi:hypothetical protein